MPPAAAPMAPRIPVSVGELIDKVTILRLKLAHIVADEKRANVARELAVLDEEARRLDLGDAVAEDERELFAVNETLWNVEEELRAHEARADFGARFVELARTVYRANDERARIKAKINAASGSLYREEKSYDGSSR